MDQLLLNQILTLIAVEHDPGADSRNIAVNNLSDLVVGQFLTAYVMGLGPYPTSNQPPLPATYHGSPSASEG